MKQPLIAVTLLYVAGLLAAELIQLPLGLLMVVLGLLLTGAIASARHRSLLLYPCLFLAGQLNSERHTAVLSPCDLRILAGTEPHLVVLSGELVETPGLRVFVRDNQATWRTMAKIQVDQVGFAKQKPRQAFGIVAVTTAGALTNYFKGQKVEVTGVLSPPKPPVAEGLFDYREYLRRQCIYYQLTSESENDWRRLGTTTSVPLADRFSAWARRALALGLPAEDESVRLEWALALGWKTALTQEASEPFVQAATYHIFAVDGLRMAILFGIFFAIFRAVSVPRPIAGVVLIPLIWFYVALTGWPASAIRASVMLTIVIAGWALKRPSNPTNSLFAAALIILLWQPQQLFQAGFQLSFFVVLCLILIIPPLHDFLHGFFEPDPMLPRQLQRQWPGVIRAPVRFGWDVTVTSLAAWIGSIPLVAYYFNIVTPVSTPANVLAVPLCILVLISNLTSLLLAAWFPGAAIIFNHAGWFTMECIRVTSIWFAAWPAAFWYVPTPGWGTILTYYAILIALTSGWIFKPRLRNLRIAGAAAAVLIWSIAAILQARGTKLTIFPAGGPVAFYDGPGTRNNLLVDTGPSNAVQFVTKPFLHAQGVNRLSALSLTHGDVRHTGGTEPLISALPVSQVVSSPVRFRSPVFRRMFERLRGTANQPTLVGPGASIRGWQVLHPSAETNSQKPTTAR